MARDPAERVIAELAASVAPAEDAQAFSSVVDVARRITCTRDPFDPIISAQALAASAVLATADQRIRTALPQLTTWD